MRSEVKRTGLFATLGLTLLAVISLAVWLGPTASDNPAVANDNLTLGVDVDTTGNSALALGTLQACRVISSGQVIDVDIYVQGISDIAAFDLYIKYDPAKINISKPGASNQGNNARFLLQQAQPSPPGNSFTNTSEALPDTSNPGILNVGGYDSVVIPGVQDPYPGTNPPQHGNGVLVRLEMQGLPGPGGFTPIQISPFSVGIGMDGPNITSSTGAPVGDYNNDSNHFVDNVINGGLVIGSGACTDSDGDGVPDSSDNCPAVSNPLQENFDGDSVGDACDADDDNDGLVDASEPASGCLPSGGGRLDPDCDNDNVSDGSLDPDGAGPIVVGPDNCITTANTNQLNTDGDSMGDACDPDDDNDTVLDAADNCPVTYNPTQTNTDGDSMGDACDPEDDGDGYLDTAEAWVGTNPLDNCGSPTSSPPIYSQSWPADLADTGSSANKITLADVTSFIVPVRIFNTSPGDLNYNQRWDIVPGSVSGKKINLQDLTSITTLTPLMFGGARAFNGPTCTP